MPECTSPPPRPLTMPVKAVLVATPFVLILLNLILHVAPSPAIQIFLQSCVTGPFQLLIFFAFPMDFGATSVQCDGMPGASVDEARLDGRESRISEPTVELPVVFRKENSGARAERAGRAGREPIAKPSIPVLRMESYEVRPRKPTAVLPAVVREDESGPRAQGAVEKMIEPAILASTPVSKDHLLQVVLPAVVREGDSGSRAEEVNKAGQDVEPILNEAIPVFRSVAYRSIVDHRPHVRLDRGIISRPQGGFKPTESRLRFETPLTVGPAVESLNRDEPPIEPLPTLPASVDSDAESVPPVVTPFAPALVPAYPEGQHLKRRAAGGKHYRRGSGAAHLGRKQSPAQSVVQAVAPQSRLPRKVRRHTRRIKRQSAVHFDDGAEDMDVDEIVNEMVVVTVDISDDDINVLIHGINSLHLEDVSGDMLVDMPLVVEWDGYAEKKSTVFDIPVEDVWIPEATTMPSAHFEPAIGDYSDQLELIVDFPMAAAEEAEVTDLVDIEQVGSDLASTFDFSPVPSTAVPWVAAPASVASPGWFAGPVSTGIPVASPALRAGPVATAIPVWVPPAAALVAAPESALTAAGPLINDEEVALDSLLALLQPVINDPLAAAPASVDSATLGSVPTFSISSFDEDEVAVNSFLVSLEQVELQQVAVVAESVEVVPIPPVTRPKGLTVRQALAAKFDPTALIPLGSRSRSAAAALPPAVVASRPRAGASSTRRAAAGSSALRAHQQKAGAEKKKAEEQQWHAVLDAERKASGATAGGNQ